MSSAYSDFDLTPAGYDFVAGTFSGAEPGPITWSRVALCAAQGVDYGDPAVDADERMSLPLMSAGPTGEAGDGTAQVRFEALNTGVTDPFTAHGLRLYATEGGAEWLFASTTPLPQPPEYPDGVALFVPREGDQGGRVLQTFTLGIFVGTAEVTILNFDGSAVRVTRDDFDDVMRSVVVSIANLQLEQLRQAERIKLISGRY